MLHIGILGHSADGSALCYLECVRESARLLGDHAHPEITMSLLPMGPTIPWWEAGDLDQINAHLRATAARLAAAGCDFFVCPDNTAHIALEASAEPYPLPGLHIAEVVAERAKADGHKRIALLGTRYTMEGPVYAAAFARHGLEMRTPGAADRELLNRIIFDELCLGRFEAPARREFLRVIEALKAEGCDAAALCCTEIPLIVTPENSSLPTLDSTRLLARAAVAVALGHAPAPQWRGGPR
ncbi:MAG: amino acid racemase [Hyphomonadaceae bacterium]|nr:amino acid racemase [Hyphomonadaceae bacterium]